MKVYTRQDLANLVPARYAAVYDSGKYGESHQLKSAELKMLPTPIDPDKVDRIIGNDSWTQVRCDECGEYRGGYVAIGNDETCVSLCFECARQIQSLLPTDNPPAAEPHTV